MEIPFRGQFDNSWAFTMNFEMQNIAAFNNADTSSLHIQTTFRRTVYNNQTQDLYPIILGLHGNLIRTNYYNDSGASLLPTQDVPINLVPPKDSELVNITFAFSTSYIQLIEEQRALQPEQVISLTPNIWGIAAMIKPDTSQKVSPYQTFLYPGEVVRFEKVFTDNSIQPIRIERSAWIDRLLPGLGYRQSVLIELPLVRTPPVPDAYKNAASTLETAQSAFSREDYRGAIKHARDVLEYLGKSSQEGQGITSFCKEYLEPFVGQTKSKAIDRSLNAIRDIVNASSHIDPQKPFVVDRAIAAYVIETLALNLRYISMVLG